MAVRSATVADAARLAELAALDSRVRLRGHVLVAEVAGIVVAARSLEDGSVAADPFERTAPLLQLLAVRAGQIGGAGITPGRSRRRMQSRFRRLGGAH